MKFLCMADLHMRAASEYVAFGNAILLDELVFRITPEFQVIRDKIKSDKYSALILGGDIFECDEKHAVNACGLLNMLQHEIGVPIYFTPGNHDFWSKGDCSSLDPDVHMVIDDTVEIIDGSGIYGYFTPWSLPFFDWCWMRPDEDNNYNIPEHVNFVVSHGPAYGVHDEAARPKTKEIEHVGSHKLYDEIFRIKRPNMKYVLTGHIHMNREAQETIDGIVFKNISYLNEQYRPKKFVFDCAEF